MPPNQRETKTSSPDDPAAVEFPTPEKRDDPPETPPDADSDELDPDDRMAWEANWRYTKFDSYEDARQNVSHIGEQKHDYEWVTEPDEKAPMTGESTRQRGEHVDDWTEPDSLY